MMFSICPSCGASAVSLFQKLAATLDSEVPVQCSACAAFAIVPNSLGLWAFTEIVIVLFAALPLFVTKHLAVAVATGVVSYVGCFAVAAWHMPLLPFVPYDDSDLQRKRVAILGVFLLAILVLAAVLPFAARKHLL
jgi:hypothetical protein